MMLSQPMPPGRCRSRRSIPGGRMAVINTTSPIQNSARSLIAL